MGYLIDEEEFEVKPAISRTVQLLEAKTSRGGRKKSYPKNPSLFPLTFNFSAGTTAYTENYKYTADLSFEGMEKISSWDGVKKRRIRPVLNFRTSYCCN